MRPQEKECSFVKFYFPSVGFEESQIQIQEIKVREPAEVKVPSKAYAFSFFDQLVMTASTGEKAYGEKKNRSGLFYLEVQEVSSFEEIKERAHKDYQEWGILYDNMRFNETDLAVKTKDGHWEYVRNNKDMILEHTTNEC